jgi:hypothetical protein
MTGRLPALWRRGSWGYSNRRSTECAPGDVSAIGDGKAEKSDSVPRVVG